MLALALALQLAVSTTPTAYLDFSATANAALVAQGYWHPTQPIIQLQGVKVPAGATIDLSGITVHTPETAAFAVSLQGTGSTEKGGTFICDGPSSSLTVAGFIDPTKLPSTLPTAIVMAGWGCRVEDCDIDWFGIGIQSAPVGAAPQISNVQMISHVNVMMPINIGIDFQGPSDSYLDHIVVGRQFGSASFPSNNNGLGLVGIKWCGGGGALSNSHVWGGFVTGIEVNGGDSAIADCDAEGSVQTLLHVNGWANQIQNIKLFYPVGSNVTAILFGTVGGNDACQNVVDGRLISLGGYGYKSLISTANGAFGNWVTLNIFDATGLPALTPGPLDKWTLLTMPKAVTATPTVTSSNQ